MRLTIEHREEAVGLARNKRNYYVHCEVAFTQEELAVIKARYLYDHNFAVRPPTALPTEAVYNGITALRVIGGLMVPIGLVIGFGSIFARSGGELGAFMLFGGIALAIYAGRVRRRQDYRLEHPQQVVRIRDLISRGRVTIHAIDPAHAKQVDDDLRNWLAILKQLIRDSTEIKSKQTYEI